ncbi:hypothetical protein [Azospirillum sp. B21]|uniref:hypothetical protein n=1 Tax=Azospirillum sp. B21 TaxID=2607496 RepID=UPI00165F9FFB|nr:hypothetical protein [Azospirillum sp. B21]
MADMPILPVFHKGFLQSSLSRIAVDDATIRNKQAKCSRFRFQFRRATVCDDLMIDVAAAFQR